MGGCEPQKSGPNNLCWNDMPCKFLRHKGAVSNLKIVTEIGTSFNGSGKFCESRRRVPLGLSGGMPSTSENF